MCDDIIQWLEQRGAGARSLSLINKKAIHRILLAISLEDSLRDIMIIKGGILMGIKYKSNRSTLDLDVSIEESYSESELENKLNNSLLYVSTDLPDDVICKVQSVKKFPKHEGATFSSLQMKIGFACRNNPNGIKRLEGKNSADVIKVDVSINEFIGSTELINLENGKTLKCYSLTSMIAEKFRSILQQEVRNRSRRQDVYDLCFLIIHYTEGSDEEKKLVHEELLKKSENKNIDEYLNVNGLDNEKIMNRSKKEYNSLQGEVSHFIQFDQAYKIVNSYFKGLPWEEI